MNDLEHYVPTPKLVVTIIDRNQTHRLEDILREKHIIFHYMFNAMGTASSEVLKAFGLSGTEKTVCLIFKQSKRVKPLMTAIMERLELTHPGNGIVFSIPISGISSTISKAFVKEFEEHRERWAELVEKETEKINQEAHYELVVSVVNQGYSENVMQAARAAGARGGTIVHARRSDVEDAVKFFGISIQAEKEIVAIIIGKQQKKELMQAISKACGIKTDAHGIIISLPVESCAGLGIDLEEI